MNEGIFSLRSYIQTNGTGLAGLARVRREKFYAYEYKTTNTDPSSYLATFHPDSLSAITQQPASHFHPLLLLQGQATRAFRPRRF